MARLYNRRPSQVFDPEGLVLSDYDALKFDILVNSRLNDLPENPPETTDNTYKPGIKKGSGSVEGDLARHRAQTQARRNELEKVHKEWLETQK